MKKIINLSLVFIAFLFMGCDPESITYEAPNGFIQFDRFPSEIGEPDDPIALRVLLGAGSNPDGVTVNFTVVSDDPSRFEISPSNGVLEIPAGEFTAEIIITPIDNFIVDGNEEVEIILQETSDKAVGIGGEGVNFASTTFIIVDDDCPVDSTAFVGTFSVTEVFTSGTNQGLRLSSVFGESYQIELSQVESDPSGTRFLATTSDGFDPYFDPGTIIRLFTCPNDVSLSNNRIADFAALTVNDSSYDESNSSITLAGPLGGFGPYEIRLRRIN